MSHRLLLEQRKYLQLKITRAENLNGEKSLKFRQGKPWLSLANSLLMFIAGYRIMIV
tara:strand:- start:658 stop:828 length:171 start_codon:yes stop_codon:yes gene_type:complete